MARKGQSRVWAAGSTGFKGCPQHNTTPVQCDISCQPQRDTGTQSPTLSWWCSLTHLPAFLLPPPHVTGCDMHTHTSHKFTLLWTSQPRLNYTTGTPWGRVPSATTFPRTLQGLFPDWSSSNPW